METDDAIRHALIDAAKDVQVRELITFLYRDHPQGAAYEALKEMLFLHDDFEDTRLQQLVEQQVLTFDVARYTVSARARQILERTPTILMDPPTRQGGGMEEFLR